MKVSLIGAHGFIGSHVADRLRARNVDVIAREKNAPPQPCDAAIHMLVMNEAGARAFVQDYANRAERLILISSADVYRAYGILIGKDSDPATSQPLIEDSPVRLSRFPYADMPDYDKIPAEQAILASGSRNCVLRLPAVFGPRDKHHRLGSWMKQLEHPPVEMGQGYANWRWTHGYVEDVAEAIALAAATPETPSRIYNVGELDTPTMLERAKQWNQALGVGDPIRVVPQDTLPYNFKQDLVIDSTRIRTELGFAEIVSAEDALERSIAWEVESGYARRPS